MWASNSATRGSYFSIFAEARQRLRLPVSPTAEIPAKWRSRMRSLAMLLVLALCVAGCASRKDAAGPRSASDSRSASYAPITFKLIAFNDFHGQLTAPGSGTRIDAGAGSQQAPVSLPTGGAAYLATVVSQLEAQNPFHAVVAAGDLIGASPLESSLFHDEPASEADATRQSRSLRSSPVATANLKARAFNISRRIWWMRQPAQTYSPRPPSRRSISARAAH
jgi:hypothetical protein